MNTVEVKEMKLSKEEFDLMAFALNSVAIRGDQAMVMVSLVDKINKAVKGEQAKQQD